ncbi:MerR family transcriptional regulator [Streptomyces albidoflavus]|jgi:DNA-binding transcriptional MerR regulator|uniref:HTH-type transcriptional activator TipA n=4 Tax=Streptomyces TaxID=1883 RepID=D6B7M0_9ACTN|nr:MULTISPECIES: MerR family transcriptional regulator [Streptomyces]KPC68420.1 transcriptional regulator [Streptomyces sp. NRRL F-6602]MYQ70033.1 MerR family transcriptional regulator [Streptomyces sp. SID4934]MYW57095.1 MerR family transcriptional regulator [Streptomyces sp. SID8370]MYW88403.1 MerR family transcriptional regulator [Streptomyces sp. SID8371]MYX50795.1 MerR family transcriptional regulator [Streptomyces sp. SID8385]NUW09824.1 MerR family transcriptional regulator [Streptomyce
MEYTVGQVAAVAGVTVRTLHHYDAIGLLSPSGRSAAGHRRYGDGDLDRLQRILFHRALGFALDEIAALLDDPDADPRAHLRRQHALLTDRIETLRRMADAVAAAMEAAQMGINLTPEEKFEVFEGYDPDQYADEARQRWGHTDAYRESQRRTASYTKADWQRLKDEFDALHARVAELLAQGVPADAPEAMDAAEEHRRFIDGAHYPCDARMHTCLADMYVADPRFTATYEAIRPGLAQYLHDAIHANARRTE